MLLIEKQNPAEVACAASQPGRPQEGRSWHVALCRTLRILSLSSRRCVGRARKGMYPQPPVLTGSAKDWLQAELFCRNGIKMSGMPSWPGLSDDDLWNIVAFLQKLPGMSEQDYGNLVKEAVAARG